MGLLGALNAGVAEGFDHPVPLRVIRQAGSRFLEPQTAVITFGIQSTPYTAAKFMRHLGFPFNVFQTTIANIDHVYIRKDLPTQPGVMIISGFADEDTTTVIRDLRIKTSFMASVDKESGKISSITGRLDIVSKVLQSALHDGCQVQTTPSSPCTFIVAIDKADFYLSFPIPMVVFSCKTRIHRAWPRASVG